MHSWHGSGSACCRLTSWQLEFSHVVEDYIRAIGSDAEDTGPKLQDVEAFRVRLGRLLSAWASLAHDPGKVAADWAPRGAPAGILSQPSWPVSFLWCS